MPGAGRVPSTTTGWPSRRPLLSEASFMVRVFIFPPPAPYSAAAARAAVRQEFT